MIIYAVYRDDNTYLEDTKFFTTRGAAESFKEEEDAKGRASLDEYYQMQLDRYNKVKEAWDVLVVNGIKASDVFPYYKDSEPKPFEYRSRIEIEEIEVHE